MCSVTLSVNEGGDPSGAWLQMLCWQGQMLRLLQMLSDGSVRRGTSWRGHRLRQAGVRKLYYWILNLCLIQTTVSAYIVTFCTRRQNSRNATTSPDGMHHYYFRQGGSIMPGVCLFVCLSVCLSVCLLATLCKNYWTDLSEKFVTNVASDKEVPVTFWKSSGSVVRIRIPDCGYGLVSECSWSKR